MALTPITWDGLWSIEGLVATGTLVLALVTVGLAFFTYRVASKTASLSDSTANLAVSTAQQATSTTQLASLTEKDVDLSRIAIEANLRPMLLGVPPGKYPGHERVRIPVGREGTRLVADGGELIAERVDDSLVLSAPFRNEGPGIAFPENASVALASDPARLYPGDISRNAVPSGERVRATFALEMALSDVPDDPEQLSAAGLFTVIVRYGDLAGNIWSSEQNFVHPFGRWEPGDVQITSIGRMGLPGSSPK